MAFYTGVAPPKSKYHNVQFGLENLDICPEREVNNKDDDDWLCSSGFDGNSSTEVAAVVEREDVGNNEFKELQKYTSQDRLEEIENKYFDERDDLVRQSFQAALNDVDEPYSFILHIMLKAFFDLFSKSNIQQSNW